MNVVRGLVNLLSALPISRGPLIMLPGALMIGAVLHMFGFDYWLWIMIASVLVAGIWGLLDWIMRRRQAKKASSLFGEGNAAPLPVQKDMAETYNQLRQKFQERVKTLKHADRTLYSQPWYLLIGEPGCGKSQSLIQSGLDFPLGKEELPGFGGTINYNFWIHSQAIVLDTAGRLAFHQEGVKDRREWEYLLNLLRKYRSAAPMNGVIIAVSAESLFENQVTVQGPDGPQKVWAPVLPTDRIAKAEILRDRLRQLQNELRIRFPVWLLITKADLIPGFTQFFRHVPPHKRFQMLGWARPGDFQARYEPQEFPDHFDSFCERLRLWGLRFLNQQGVWSAQSEENWLVTRFADELQLRGTALTDYVNTIFQPNDLVQPPFFRGFFFTSSMLVGAPRSGLPFREDLADIGAEEVSFPEAASAPDKAAVAYFLKDLYEEKVFPERGLLVPAANREARRRRNKQAVLMVGSVMVAAMLCVVAGMLGRVSKVIRAAETDARDAFIFTHRASEPPRWISEQGRDGWKDNQPVPTDDLKPEQTFTALQNTQTEFQGLSIRLLGWLTPGVSAKDVGQKLEVIGRELFLTRVLPYWLSQAETSLQSTEFREVLDDAVSKKAPGLESGDVSQNPKLKALTEYIRWYAMAHTTGPAATSQPDWSGGVKALLAISDQTKDIDLARYSKYLQEAMTRPDVMRKLFERRWYSSLRKPPEEIINNCLANLNEALAEYANLEKPAGLKTWRTLMDDTAQADEKWDKLKKICAPAENVLSVEDYDKLAETWFTLAVELTSLQRTAEALPAQTRSPALLAKIRSETRDAAETSPDEQIAIAERLFRTFDQSFPGLYPAPAGRQSPELRKYNEMVDRVNKVRGVKQSAFTPTVRQYQENGEKRKSYIEFCRLVTGNGQPFDRNAERKPETLLPWVERATAHLTEAIETTAAAFDDTQTDPLLEPGKLEVWTTTLKERLSPAEPAPQAAGNAARAGSRTRSDLAPTQEEDPSGAARCQIVLEVANRRYQATKYLLAIDKEIRVSADKPDGIASCCVKFISAASDLAPSNCTREDLKSTIDQLLYLRKVLAEGRIPDPQPSMTGRQRKPFPLLSHGGAEPNALVKATDELIWGAPWEKYLTFYFEEWDKWYKKTGGDVEGIRAGLIAVRTWPAWYRSFQLDGATTGQTALRQLASLIENVARAESVLSAQAGPNGDPYKPARDSLQASRAKKWEQLQKWHGWVTMVKSRENSLALLDEEWSKLINAVEAVDSYLQDPKKRPEGVGESLMAFREASRRLNFAEKVGPTGFHEPQYIERLILLAQDAENKLKDRLDNELAGNLQQFHFENRQYPFDGAEPPPASAETRVAWDGTKPMIELPVNGLVRVGDFWRLLEEADAFESRYKDFPCSVNRGKFREACQHWRKFLTADPPDPNKPPPQPQLRSSFGLSVGYLREPSAGIENMYTHLEFAGLFQKASEDSAVASLDLSNAAQFATEGWLRFNDPAMDSIEVRLVDRNAKNPQLKLVGGPANPLAFLMYLTAYGTTTPDEEWYTIRYIEGGTAKTSIRAKLASKDGSKIRVPERIPWLVDPLALPANPGSGEPK